MTRDSKMYELHSGSIAWVYGDQDSERYWDFVTELREDSFLRVRAVHLGREAIPYIQVGDETAPENDRLYLSGPSELWGVLDDFQLECEELLEAPEDSSFRFS